MEEQRAHIGAHARSGGHALAFDFDRGAIVVRSICNEPPNADCRAQPRNGCRCDDYTVLRADDGTPYHRVDTFGGAEVLHWMDDGGDCNAARALEGDTLSMSEGSQQFRLAEVPITLVSKGDHYTWQRRADDHG